MDWEPVRRQAICSHMVIVIRLRRKCFPVWVIHKELITWCEPMHWQLLGARPSAHTHSEWFILELVTVVLCCIFVIIVDGFYIVSFLLLQGFFPGIKAFETQSTLVIITGNRLAKSQILGGVLASVPRSTIITQGWQAITESLGRYQVHNFRSLSHTNKSILHLLALRTSKRRGMEASDIAKEVLLQLECSCADEDLLQRIDIRALRQKTPPTPVDELLLSARTEETRRKEQELRFKARTARANMLKAQEDGMASEMASL